MTAPALPERLSRNRFTVIGRAGMDLNADPPGTPIEEAAGFTTSLGGSAANIAAAITRAGGAADLVTRVSDDAVGRYVLGQLDRYGIGRRHVTPIGGEHRNTLAVVESRDAGHQAVLYRNNAADLAFSAADLAGLDLSGTGGLVTAGTVLALEPSRSATFEAMDRATAAGVPLIFDIDYRPYSWPTPDEAREVLGRAARAAQIVVGNDAEFDVLGDGLAAARSLARQGTALVIYKMGPEGALTLWPGGEMRTGIYPVTPLKPVGAGDAFLGTALVALATGAPLRDAILRGSAAAAMVVSRVGCAPAIPTPHELDAFIASAAPTEPES